MEGHPVRSDGHQLHTTSAQEIMTEQRQDVPMLPCGPAKQGRRTVRELARRRRQRLQQLLQQQAPPQAE